MAHIFIILTQCYLKNEIKFCVHKTLIQMYSLQQFNVKFNLIFQKIFLNMGPLQPLFFCKAAPLQHYYCL